MPALRLALPGDAPSLAILAERTFRDAFGARNSPENMDLHCAKRFGPDIQMHEIGERGLVTTLADAAGSLAGFTQLRLAHPSPAVTARKPAELSRIYVAAEWQGRGVAKALMERALADAARAGCDRLWLGVWEHNPKAMAFYGKFGFEFVGTQSFMLGRERQRDLVMAVDVRLPR
jgi:ribosomal protein S18 acetylase RimI-like enzyme